MIQCMQLFGCTPDILCNLPARQSGDYLPLYAVPTFCLLVSSHGCIGTLV
jgi:hypothetical protein